MASIASASPEREDIHASFRIGPPRDPGPPIALVHGNCQAEALRALLPADAVRTVRIPPAHELCAGDLPALDRWLRHAEFLVVQPIRRGYRGLPIGTADLLAAAPPGIRCVLFPVIRFAGLYPDQVIVRPPGDPGAVPPLVAYHSLRTLLRAAGRRLAALRPAAVRAIADASLAELRRREHDHGTVEVSGLFTAPRFDLMRTINHPGEPVMRALAERVVEALGVEGEVGDVRRPPLDAVHAPREPAVVDAFGLHDEPTDDWIVDGERLDAATVAAAHLRWYAERPEVVAAGLARHRLAIETIGVT